MFRMNRPSYLFTFFLSFVESTTPLNWLIAFSIPASSQHSIWPAARSKTFSSSALSAALKLAEHMIRDLPRAVCRGRCRSATAQTRACRDAAPWIPVRDARRCCRRRAAGFRPTANPHRPPPPESASAATDKNPSTRPTVSPLKFMNVCGSAQQNLFSIPFGLAQRGLRTCVRSPSPPSTAPPVFRPAKNRRCGASSRIPRRDCPNPR